MEVIIQSTPEKATQVAAKIIASLLGEKPDAVLGVATGSTPLGLYQTLIGMSLDWNGVTAYRSFHRIRKIFVLSPIGS